MGWVFQRDWEKGAFAISLAACFGELVDRFDMPGTSSVSASSSVGLRLRQEGEKTWKQRYRGAIRGLLWLAITTCLKISSTVRDIARRAQDPSVNKHWRAVTKILQYLKGTGGVCLTCRKAARCRLEAVAGASHAEGKKYCRYYTMFGGEALS